MKNIDVNSLAELQKDNIRRLILVDLDFETNSVYYHSGLGDYAYNGNTYTGVGNLGSISVAQEDSELSAPSITLELSGIDPSSIFTTLSEHYQGRPVRIREAYLDEDYQFIGEPILVFEGTMDNTSISIGKEEATISLVAVSKLEDWGRPNVSRYSHEDQQEIDGTDNFFIAIEQSVEKTLYWGVKRIDEVKNP